MQQKHEPKLLNMYNLYLLVQKFDVILDILHTAQAITVMSTEWKGKQKN